MTPARKHITAARSHSPTTSHTPQGGDRDKVPTELRWYFNEADGDVSGLRSSHESFVNACSGVTGSQGQLPEAYQESGRAMRAVIDAKAVHATLAVIGEPHWGVLRAYYKQEKHGPEGEHDDTFGEWAGVVLRARGSYPVCGVGHAPMCPPVVVMLASETGITSNGVPWTVMPRTKSVLRGITEAEAKAWSRSPAMQAWREARDAASAAYKADKEAAMQQARQLVADAHREYARMRGEVRRRLREERAALMMGVRL